LGQRGIHFHFLWENLHAESEVRVFRLEAKTGKASDRIELSTRQNFVLWLPGGELLRGWARSASGDTAEGISRIEDGVRDYRATGSILAVPCWLALLRRMTNTETVNVVSAIIFVVSYVAIAVLPRAIRYFADRERNPTDDDL
jgi:hypothetical protein